MSNPNMEAVISSLEGEDKKLAQMLVEQDQGHLFSKWDPASPDHKAKAHAFFEQVRANFMASEDAGSSCSRRGRVPDSADLTCFESRLRLVLNTRFRREALILGY
jgi:hypothetical protein